jgi:adenine-specific DNA glycosylase
LTVLNIEPFVHRLLEWYPIHKRDLPWRNTNNPYIIWLSEIILQQTRVVQGLPYFERYLENYPTLEDLAKAPSEEVMRLWQGLVITAVPGTSMIVPKISFIIMEATFLRVMLNS